MAQPTLALREASIATQATAAPKQRMDIQGLRAIAVIAVIADHLFDYPTGGFVGVDIFFVISGFLITGLLLREHHRNGRIDFGGFYRRRVRRIIPVAVFVLAVTVGATYLTFSAARAGGVLADSLWSLGFAANWHFAIIGTDYWQSDGLVSPLQHFWSLAVEEQFYIVWPWLIILALTSRKRVLRGSRGLYVVMGLAAAVSFLYALWQTAEQPTWAYFSTFSRAWELAAGALIAVASPLLSKIRPWVAATIAWAGLGLILVSIFVVQPDSGFPAPGASLPVLATAMVIVGGINSPKRQLVPLTNAVSQYLGKISYSLYLWHFPVIILLAAYFPEKGLPYYIICILIMMALSVFSFHSIEDPVRHSNWLEGRISGHGRQGGAGATPRVKYLWLSMLLVTACAVSALALVKSGSTHGSVTSQSASVASGATSQPQTEQQRLANEISTALAATTYPPLDPGVDALGTANWVKEVQKDGCADVDSTNVSSCVFGPADASKTVAVFGDSFAIAWMPGIRAALEPLGYKVQALTRGQCPAALVSVKREGGTDYPECDSHRTWAIGYINEIKPDITILASAHGTLARLTSGLSGDAAAGEVADGLTSTIDQIKGSAGKMIVLGSPPGGKNLQECVTNVGQPSDCASMVTPESSSFSEIESRVASATGAHYVDTRLWFCNDYNSCPGFVGTTPVRADVGHITTAYSKKLAPVLAGAIVTDAK